MPSGEMGTKPKIVAFCCERSGMLAARMASTDKAPPVDSIKMVSVPCTGSVQTIDILKALRSGADGVVIFSCHEGSCEHLVGNRKAKRTVEYVADILTEIGWNPDRVAFFPVAAVEGQVFRDRLGEVVDRLRGLTVGR